MNIASQQLHVARHVHRCLRCRCRYRREHIRLTDFKLSFIYKRAIL